MRHNVSTEKGRTCDRCRVAKAKCTRRYRDDSAPNRKIPSVGKYRYLKWRGGMIVPIMAGDETNIEHTRPELAIPLWRIHISTGGNSN
jgi:hypothetical protein